MDITGTTKLTGLLGSPVAHSISPQMHNESFRLLGLDYVYLAFDVGTKDLKTAVEGLKALGVRGFNLTMPDKTAMLELADELTPAARLSGACNTVIHENGRLIGHTTDGIGFMDSVKYNGCNVTGRQITLLGAGGAAKAICVQAALDGVKQIDIFRRSRPDAFARTEQFAKKTAEETGCRIRVMDISDRRSLSQSLETCTLLANATNAGMAPDIYSCPIPEDLFLPPDLSVCDIIYNPRQTRLMQLAEQAGCRTFNGLYMLLYQGAAAFSCWTGMEMPVEAIREKYFRQ